MAIRLVGVLLAKGAQVSENLVNFNQDVIVPFFKENYGCVDSVDYD